MPAARTEAATIAARWANQGANLNPTCVKFRMGWQASQSGILISSILSTRCSTRFSYIEKTAERVSSKNMDHSRIRVLVAKPGLDGHDRGAKVIARALRDAGMEVVYTGLRQTPEMIVNAALQEDVQVIGLSILSGAHNAIVPRVMELLKEKQMSDVLVIVGGIVPDEDAAQLKLLGVAQVYQPGASLDTIVNFIRSSVKQTA